MSNSTCSQQEAEEYIRTLLKHFDDLLTEWELTFLKDLLGHQGSWSEKQRAKIDEIMTRVSKGYDGSSKSTRQESDDDL